MRWLWTLLLALSLHAGIPAQQRMATVELEDGRQVRGLVLSMDVGGMVLEVSGQPETIAATRIRSCQFETVTEPARGAEGAAGHGTAAAARPAAVPAQRMADDRTPWQRRISDLNHRYPWLAPEEPVQWVSLLATLFALAALGIHLAGRLAGAEGVAFGRSVFLSGFLLGSALLQAACVPAAGMFLSGTAFGTGVAGLILFRLLFRIGYSSALVALAIVLVEAGVGFLVLELVDAVLRSIGGEWVL